MAQTLYCVTCKRMPNLEVTVKRIWIYILGGLCLSSGFVGCGERDASISLLSATMDLKLSANEPKKLQMVIIGDPTKSMADAQTKLASSFPAFTQQLVNTGFNFDIFCATTSYNGGEITSLKVQNYRTASGFDFARLSQDIGKCINTTLVSGDGDERGLEAAKKTWEKVISSKALDPTAVKLTMVVTNEDDCSRDLDKYPAYESQCRDQSARPGSSVPVTDFGNTEDGRTYETSRYVDFFNKYLTYEDKDEKSGLVRKRGHIFAPVILQPPSDIGKDAAYACIQEKANSITPEVAKEISAYVMSFGVRYFEVAAGTNNRTYSLCGNIANILNDVNDDVQKEVSKKAFYLSRRPADPAELQITVLRQISDAEKAASILLDMQRENSSLPQGLNWTQKNDKVWERVMTVNNGFAYVPATNEIILEDRYAPFNDILKISPYKPAGFDGKVNYGSNEHLN